MMKNLAKLKFLPIILLFAPHVVFAACSEPTGNAGDQVYNASVNVMQYCDGDDWISMGGKFSGSGSWTQSGGNLYYNSGNVGIGTSSPSTALEVKGIITAGDVIRLANEIGTSCVMGGEIRYSSTDKSVQVCDGSAWQSAGISKFPEVGAVLYVGADQKIARDVDNFAWNVGTSALTVGKKISFKSIEGNEPSGMGAEPDLVMADITDVNVSSAAVDDVLSYNGSTWINRTLNLEKALDDLTDVNVPSPSSGDALTYNGAEWVNVSPLWLKSASDIYYSAGNVGIGTSAPKAKLHSSGDFTLDWGASAVYSPRVRLVTATNHWNIDNYQGRLRFYTEPGYNQTGTEYLSILPSGNVGIGTVAPGASGAGWAYPAFEVSGTRGTAILRTTTATTGYATLRFVGPTAGSDVHLNMNDGTGKFTISPQSGSVAGISIAKNGYVGAATNSPFREMTVNGEISIVPNAYNGTTGFINVSDASGSNGNLNHLQIRGLASNATAGATLTSIQMLASTVYLNGVVVHSSDARLKKDISNIDNALDKVQQLNGVYFRWNGKNGIISKDRQIGLIAQDVEKVMPEAVLTSEADGYKSVAYSNLVGLVVNAIKEQQKIIESQRAEIDSLKADFAKLRADLSK